MRRLPGGCSRRWCLSARPGNPSSKQGSATGSGGSGTAPGFLRSPLHRPTKDASFRPQRGLSSCKTAATWPALSPHLGSLKLGPPQAAHPASSSAPSPGVSPGLDEVQ